MRDELHLELAGHHLPLGLGIEPDVTDDGLAQQLGLDKLADPPARHRGIVGDDGKIAFALTHDFVDDPLGRADRHEPADHQACAVWDHRDRLIELEGLHVSWVLLSGTMARYGGDRGYLAIWAASAGVAVLPGWHASTSPKVWRAIMSSSSVGTK